MSQVSSKHPLESADATTASSNQRRPGWIEIVVAAVVYLVIVLLAKWGYQGHGFSPVIIGISEEALSAGAALGAFAVAVALRVRSWSFLGVRRTSWRWLLLGLGAAVLTWLLSRLVLLAFVALTGITTSPQAGYNSASSGGTLAFILSLIFLAIATPICEEFLFRGLLTTTLLRYGPVIGVVGSAVIFALAHGINVVLPIAFVIGLVNAELRRRSGSVWPGVVVHVFNNLVTVLAPTLLAGMR